MVLCIRRILEAGLAGAVALAFMVAPANAETATVYGTVASILTKHPGAFLPANTNFVCLSMNGSKCWDGKKWFPVFPSGPRHYAVPTTEKVGCTVILDPSNDCWDGSRWYRLPRGQIFGVIGNIFSQAPGAFITTPIQANAKTYISAAPQSPVSRVADKR